jgi:hypothetical protein
MTGTYWYDERGAWVFGPRAVLLVALQIGLKVPPSWYAENGLLGVTLARLRACLRPRPEAAVTGGGK